MMGPQERSHAESGSPGFSSLTKRDSLFSSLRERREFAEHQECGPTSPRSPSPLEGPAAESAWFLGLLKHSRKAVACLPSY